VGSLIAEQSLAAKEGLGFMALVNGKSGRCVFCYIEIIPL